MAQGFSMLYQQQKNELSLKIKINTSQARPRKRAITEKVKK